MPSSTRSRIRTRQPTVGGGGGGGTPPTIQWGPDFGRAGDDLGVGAHCALGAVSGVASSMMASKDTWVDNVAGCAVDTVRNATNLQVDGVTATRKDALIAWDLSAFPVGTVQSASVDLYVVTAPLLTAYPVICWSIANADEGWSETVIKCSSHPANVTNMQTFSFPPGVIGDQSFVLNAAVLSRMSARLGVGPVTLYLGANLDTHNITLQSKDTSGSPNNANGPRLSLTFSVP